MPQCGLRMNNVSFLKQWGNKYVIGIIVGLLMSVGFLVMDADRWIGMHTLNQKTAKYTVVIDSGHGGVDPGKIGVDGVYEKDINLAIAKQLQKVLERNDCQVIMTREADQGLYEESDTNKKRADMAKRVSIMNGCDADVVVSIHQNSYTDATSRGAQVFYQATSESGKQLAAKIQETLKRDVAPDNRRQIKANADYYLLKNTTSTMVIVECGFLSNLQEAKQLQEAEYQKKVAQAIGMGVLYYLGEYGETKQRKEDSNGDENTAGQSGAVWR